MSSSTLILDTTTYKCTDRYSFPEWYTYFKTNCLIFNVWHYFDPDAEDIQDDTPVLPSYLDWVETYEQARKERFDRRNVQNTGVIPSAQLSSAYSPADENELAQIYQLECCRFASCGQRIVQINREKVIVDQLWNWVQKTVSSDLLTPRTILLVTQKQYTIQQAIRNLRRDITLRRDIGMSSASIANAVRMQYRNHLLQASRSDVEPSVWVREMIKQYHRAKVYNIPEISGFIGLNDFLNAVETRIAPEWARGKLYNLITDVTLGQPVPDLSELIRTLQALLTYKSLLDRA